MPRFESSPQLAAHPVLEVFACFLRLGMTSFGGPIAHLAYFRREFVEHRKWLDEHQYAQLLALCQFLPGPASSQLGFSIGMLRAGFAGAMAAFIAFTLPSASLMYAFAVYLPALSGPDAQTAIHGLKLVAVAVVAHGLFGMGKQLCPDWPRRIVALCATAILLTWNIPAMQLVVVALGAVAGMCCVHDATVLPDASLPVRHSVRTGWVLLATFTILLLVLPILAHGSLLASAMAAFYRAGALVFGGGHVVLPLLQESVVDTGWISTSDFLAGYGAAQAVPGPMFSLAAHLGASLPDQNGGAPGAMLALLLIFLPGLLLIAGMLPLWHILSRTAGAARLIAGINAAVVGLLAAALYDPVWISAVNRVSDLVIAAAGFALLQVWRVSALWVVVWCVVASVVTDWLLPV